MATMTVVEDANKKINISCFYGLDSGWALHNKIKLDAMQVLQCEKFKTFFSSQNIIHKQLSAFVSSILQT